MKILMVSSFLPFPLFSGGHVRLYNLIKELSGKHEITLVCEKRDNQTQKEIEEIEKICEKVITVNRKKQWTVKNIAKSVGSPNSFLVTGHTHQEMQGRISKELENNKFDIIHIETFYVYQNLPSVSIPVVLVEHNIEYLVYQKFADSVSPFLRPFLKQDVAKIRKEEEASWRRATKLVAVSSDDKKVMENADIVPEIVANGVDVDKFRVKLKTKNVKYKKVLFIGDFKWIQNRDAAKYILEEIWPEIKLKIKTENTQVKLWIVGRKIPAAIKALTSESDVLLDEESSVRPTEELFQEADVLLAPIRVGGGTSYKILESMSCGTPVVTTPLSADAIEATDNENILVGRTPAELAEKTVKILVDEKLYETIVVNGRKLIEEKYKWKKIASDLENIYNDLK